MRVVIAYPPDFNRPTMVFGALPLFNAVLKQAGHETLLVDQNAEAFSHCLKPGNLERYFGVFDGAVEALKGAAETGPAAAAQLRELRRLLVYPRDLMLEARSAAAGLRDPERFFDPVLYRRMDRTIRTTHAFLNAFTPQLDPRHETYRRDLHAWLDREDEDVYTDYYRFDLIPRLVAFKPDLVALSCPFSPQVGTGLLFAKLMRRAMPGLRFVMGGTGLSDATELILNDDRFHDLIDFGITGDGENGLTALCEAMEGRTPWDAVPGLWRRVEGVVRPPVSTEVFDLDRSPTPDYRDVDFRHYMLPEKAGIYTTSRGCYYGKCTFCPESFRKGFRKRSPERVYDDVKNLVLEQGVRYLHFFDPLTPPVTLEHVSKKAARDDLPVHWYAEVKFEKIYTNRDYVRKLAAGGCRQLQFGVESGVQRVLDRMKKGNNLAHIEIILDNLREFGISMAGTWFIGFPTESEDEARETWRYWRRHADEMQLSLYTGTFCLGPDVPVWHRPEDYGVRLEVAADGYAHCIPLDGRSWDKEPLHTAFHVRSDIEVTICGAGLLYAAHHPERLYALRNVNMVGPTSMDEPPIEERIARRSAESTLVPLDPTLDGATGYRGLVSESLRIFDLDEADAVLLETVGRDGRRLGEVIAGSTSPTDCRARLARLIDRGFLESRDPISAGLTFQRC